MTKAKTLVGLDVHATKIVAAVLDAETGQLQTFGMSGDAGGAVGFCAGLARPVRVAYEARSDGLRLSARARRARDPVRGRGAEQDPQGVGGQGQNRSS